MSGGLSVGEKPHARWQPPAWLIWLAAALLGLLATAYLLKGFVLLVRTPEGAKDLHARWIEEHYALRRQNPYDVYFHQVALDEGTPPPVTDRDTSVDPRYGLPSSSGYPPWTFFTQALFLWPQWTAARWLFAAIDLCALGVFVWWGFGIGKAGGTPARAAARAASAAALIAISTICTTLGNGQYGVVVVALLAAALLIEEPPAPASGAASSPSDADDGARRASARASAVAAGLLCAISLIKPNISLPFVLAYLVLRRYATLATILIFNLVACAVVWWLVHTNPLVMIHQMLDGARRFTDSGADVSTAITSLGVPAGAAAKLTALGVPVLALLIMVLWRHAPLSVLFAVAAVGGRLWTYHHIYDDVMIAFLLAALLGRAWITGDLLVWLAVAMTGISLWPPAKVIDSPHFRSLTFVIWIASLGVLLWSTRRRTLSAAFDERSPLERCA